MTTELWMVFRDFQKLPYHFKPSLD